MGIEKIKVVKAENGANTVSFTGNLNNRNRTYLTAAHDTTSFTGKADSLLDCAEVLTESLRPKHRSVINWMKSLEWLKGEIGGILITALGTGLVAPIFIGFNPFVHAPEDATEEEKKEVNNTKMYTAMRQPISAVLAILFQASVQKYIDKGLDAIFNNKDYSKKVRLNADQCELNTDTYIKGIVKEDMKKAGEVRPSIFKALFSKDARVKRAVYDEKFDKLVKETQEKQLETLVNHFAGKDDSKTKGIIKIGDRVLDNKTMAEIINKQIENYKKDTRKLMKTEEVINKYADKAETLINNEPFFKNLAGELPLKEIENAQFKELVTQILPIKELQDAKDPKVLRDLRLEADEKLDKLLENIGDKYPEKKAFLEDLKSDPDKLVAKCKTASEEANKDLPKYYKQLTDKVMELWKNETDSALKDELKAILDRPEDLRANRVSRIIQRIHSIREMCKKMDGGYTRENYVKAMLAKDDILKARIVQLEGCKITDLERADRNVVNKTIAKITEALKFDRNNPTIAPVLKDADIFGSNKDLSRKVYEDVAKVYKNLVKESYRSINQVTKIMVGACITLPITCTALNWVYPRFMEIFFPKLAGVKKAQAQKDGGDK